MSLSPAIVPGSVVCIRHAFHENKWLSTDGKKVFFAKAKAEWERFVVKDAGGGKFYFHNPAHKVNLSSRGEGVAGTSTNEQSWEAFQVIPGKLGLALLGEHKTHLSGDGTTCHFSPNLDTWESWIFEPVAGMTQFMFNATVFLRSTAHNKYMTSGPKRCFIGPNRRDWETWQLQDGGNGKVQLFNTFHKTYLSFADPAAPPVPTATPGATEKFDLVIGVNGVSFRLPDAKDAKAAPSYICAVDADNTLKLTPNLKSWESWAVEPVPLPGSALAAHQRWSVELAVGGTGYVSVALDGRVLDVMDGSRAPGAQAIVFDKGPHLSPNQQWDYKDGYLYSRLGNGLVLEVVGGVEAVKDNAALALRAPANLTSQKWDVDFSCSAAGGGWGAIRSRHNNALVLALAPPAKAAKGVAKVVLDVDVFPPYPLFTAVAVRALATNKYLSTDGKAVSVATAVGANERWMVQDAGTQNGKVRLFSPTHNAWLSAGADGVMRLATPAKNWEHFDVRQAAAGVEIATDHQTRLSSDANGASQSKNATALLSDMWAFDIIKG